MKKKQSKKVKKKDVSNKGHRPSFRSTGTLEGDEGRQLIKDTCGELCNESEKRLPYKDFMAQIALAEALADPDAVNPIGASEIENPDIQEESSVENYKILLDFAHAQIAALADELELECDSGMYLLAVYEALAYQNQQLAEDVAFAAERIEGRDSTIQFLKEKNDLAQEYINYLHQGYQPLADRLTPQQARNLWSEEFIERGKTLRKHYEANLETTQETT